MPLSSTISKAFPSGAPHRAVAALNLRYVEGQAAAFGTPGRGPAKASRDLRRTSTATHGPCAAQGGPYGRI